MFHINGWGIAYGCFIGGTKLVLRGVLLPGASLYELLENEKVTVSAGVPTVWLQLLLYVEQHNLRFSSLQRVTSGGSAAPLAIVAKFDERFGIEVRQGWGMTETTAVATMSCATREQLQREPAHPPADPANC